MTSATNNDNFSQVELDKFNELAHRWWGAATRLRTTGSRVTARPAVGEPKAFARHCLEPWANAPRAARGRAGRAGSRKRDGVAPWMAAMMGTVR